MFGACPFHVPVFKQLPCTQSCWETCRLHKFLVNGTRFCPLAIAGKTMYRCLAKLGLLYLLPRSLGQMHWKTESVQWYWVLKPNLASRSVKTTCKLKLKRRNRHISFSISTSRIWSLKLFLVEVWKYCTYRFPFETWLWRKWGSCNPFIALLYALCSVARLPKN